MLFDKELYLGGLLLRWKQPRKLLRTNSEKRCSTVWIILLVLFSGWSLYLIIHQKYSHLFVMIFTTTVMWVFNNLTPTYEFRDGGILYESGKERTYFKWTDIMAYSVVQLDNEHRVGMIYFTLKHRKFWQRCPAFFYDPNRLDKLLILSILEEKLPHKEYNYSIEDELLRLHIGMQA